MENDNLLMKYTKEPAGLQSFIYEWTVLTGAVLKQMSYDTEHSPQ